MAAAKTTKARPKRITAAKAAAQMREQYGEEHVYRMRCQSCCNCQLKKRTENGKYICIAYSRDMYWDPQEKTCGLFNRPFRGLIPALKTLEEYLYGPKTEESEKTVQTTLWD